MNVCVLLFASFREAVGANRVELELPDGTSAEDLFAVLRQEHPQLEELQRFTTFAVNREVVNADAVLHDGDEIALLQPVSGGAA